MNRIRHGRENVVGKQKHELFEKQYAIVIKSNVIKKLGFQGLRDLLNSGMNKKVFGIFYRATIRSGKKRKKVLEECRKKQK